MSNPSDRMPEMRVDVSVGAFHGTHDQAHAMQDLVKKGVGKMSVSELRAALSAMNAGQRLTNAEDGLDLCSRRIITTR